jgi:hypothetical protein
LGSRFARYHTGHADNLAWRIDQVFPHPSDDDRFHDDPVLYTIRHSLIDHTTESASIIAFAEHTLENGDLEHFENPGRGLPTRTAIGLPCTWGAPGS